MQLLLQMIYFLLLIDNHIYYGNELGFEKVTWKRCVDLNDRQLRKVETGLSGEEKNSYKRRWI